VGAFIPPDEELEGKLPVCGHPLMQSSVGGMVDGVQGVYLQSAMCFGKCCFEGGRGRHKISFFSSFPRV
jgi:hypothetical protein